MQWVARKERGDQCTACYECSGCDECSPLLLLEKVLRARLNMRSFYMAKRFLVDVFDLVHGRYWKPFYAARTACSELLAVGSYPRSEARRGEGLIVRCYLLREALSIWTREGSRRRT
jgi:hypothetical protein